VVKEYFNTAGFERWNKIYSDSDEVNKVQLDIRTGHQQTVDKVRRAARCCSLLRERMAGARVDARATQRHAL
jgi:hypothetical protein